MDLELWTITFSGLAKPHCPVCSSPYHQHDDCPSSDPVKRQRRNQPAAVCFDFNKGTGCRRRNCSYRHVCRRCSSSSHAAPACPQQPSTQPKPSSASAAKSKVDRRRRQELPYISSPIDIDILASELSRHPNPNFVRSLLNALKEGVRIGYTGPQRTRVSRNLISAFQHREVVSSNLVKEVSLGRVVGPFSSFPLPNFQCHPVGVVPKKHSSEWRTIYHLSLPEGDSITDHIHKDKYSLQYVRVDDAIRILQRLGKGAFMAKTDLKSAFRLIPIHPDDWNLLGVHWQSKFYVDLYLPFGLRSAPYLFNQLSEAFEWILKNNYGLKHVLHILDDFFIAESNKLDCLTSFSTLLKVFMSLKAPVVASKTLGPSRVLEFMGIELDSVRMEACLPRDKLSRISAMLDSFQTRRSIRLQSLMAPSNLPAR